MKKILTLLAIALVTLTSCKPDEEEISPSEVYLNVYYDDIVFPSDGGEDSFEIESNGDWVITNDADWLTIDPSEGKGSCSIALTASASDLYDDRNTVITVKAGDKTETFTVTQKYAEALLVTKNKFDIPQEGGEFTVEVQSNISYDIVIDEGCQSWITEVPSSKALNTYTHTFSVESNQDTTKRDGSIEIIGSNGKTETVNIYQAQKGELVLSKSVEIVPAKGGEVRVQLRSNVDYEVIVPEDVDWVEQLQSDKADELVFNVKPNSSDRNREAKITIKDKNSDLSQIFRITQTVGRIILEENYFEIGAKGGIVELNLSTDIDIKVVIPDNIDWITVVQTKSLEAKTISLDIEPNDKEEERVAIITIQDINSPLSQNVEIRQTPYDYYIGDISAETEEDLIAIREAGYEVINGDLTISGNSIITLSHLDNKIKEINGDLYINCPSLLSLDGLYSLNYIKGDLHLKRAGIEQFEGLNNLKEIGRDFIIGETTQTSIFDGSWLNSLTSFEGLDNLTTIGGTLSILYEDYYWTYNVTRCGNLRTFKGLKNLKEIGGLKIEDVHFEMSASPLASFEGLESLERINGDFIITGEEENSFSYLSSFKGLNNLKEITGEFKIENVDGDLTSYEGLGSLETIGTFNAIVGVTTFAGLSSLKKVSKDFIMEQTYPHYESLQGLSSLEYIGGNFIPTGAFTSLKGLENLSRVDGNFVISRTSRNIPNISSLEGLSSLSIVNGDFEVINAPDLQDLKPLSNLSTVLGTLHLDGGVLSVEGLDNLHTVGNLNISLDITSFNGINIQNVTNIKISSCPQLSDLSALSKSIQCHVNDIMIQNCESLYDFSSLVPIVETMTGTWVVTGCGYNPTKYQMLNGESKPQE